MLFNYFSCLCFLILPGVYYFVVVIMDQLILSIQDYPVIVQGAMGSALFALVLFVGQRMAAYGLDRFRAGSRRVRKRQIKEEYIRLRALGADDYSEGAYFGSLLWIRASRHFVKALIWLVLGMIFDSTIGVLGVVGYMGAVFYLFFALSIVRPISYDGDVKARAAELKEELDQLVDGV